TLYWLKLGEAAEVAADGTADAARREGLLRRARQALERAVALVPADAYGHHNVGRLLGRLARQGLASPAEAFTALDTALRRDPANAVFIADAADTALSLGDLARMRAYAERGHALYPAYAPFLGHLGYLALREKRYADAIVHLRAALAWGADRPSGWKAAVGTCLAQSLLVLDHYAEALEAATEALRHTEVAAARYGRGKALELLGRSAEAAGEYRRALKEQPDYGPARAALARLEPRL